MRSRLRVSVFVLVLLSCSSLAGGAALAGGSQEGALRAAFESHNTGMATILYTSPTDRVIQASAPTRGVEGRIVPFVDGQTFCSDRVLGTWIGWTEPEEYKDLLPLLDSEFTLDGNQLVDLERTPVKRFTKPFWAPGEKWWGFTQGVPVLGTLGVGTHFLETQVFESGVLLVEFAISFEVLDCG